MKLNRIFLTFILTFVFCFALTKDEIKPKFELELKDITVILHNKNLDSQAKSKAIFNIVDKYFDYKQMAEISLGKKYYTSLDEKQKEEFDKLFEKNLKDSFVDKLKAYNNEEIEILKAYSPSDKRYVVESQIFNKNDTYAVNYKFFPASKDNWKIYDIDILGVSVVMTYKNQFKDVIARGNFEDLIKKLKSININEEIK